MGRRLDERLASLRCAKHVAAQRIWTLERLAELTEAEVLAIQGVGPVALAEISEVLWENDLELAAGPAEPTDGPPVVERPADDAPDGPGAVELAVRSRVGRLPERVAASPHAAIAVRLARELDDVGMAATAKELRSTLAELDGLAPPLVDGDLVDEVAARRAHRHA